MFKDIISLNIKLNGKWDTPSIISMYPECPIWITFINATIDEILIIYQHEKNNILFSYPVLEVSLLVLKIDS